ncbi:uncharacterized protein PAC_04338 [Phialocephala subalpina]|uniref:F-box domain-containing protein n=1 Tax=Phialocephala subalpina TaxID=576137 RepID=A0A1L7WNW1_9HELO|nr:uncharacterized protein PAC_04338 [Phialocephala subalpina]
MASLPHEIKRLIFDSADIHTIKALRLVSSSWASIGLEVLLLPTFVIKSPAVDFQRLVDIGNHYNTAQQAAKTINTLEFRDNEYDPTYLRHVLCSRHVQVSDYERVDFVPSQSEQASLDEIDAVIELRKLENKVLSHGYLRQAFGTVPRLHTIKFTSPNPFQQHLLRKVWDEYNLTAYRTIRRGPGYLKLSHIFSVINGIRGLNVEHFTHELCTPTSLQFDIRRRESAWLHGLRIVNLTINNVRGPRDWAINPSISLSDLFITNLNLEELSLKFESLERIPLDFLPTDKQGCLKTLSLATVAIEPTSFLSFLSFNSSSLKRLSIANSEMADQQFTWQGFLEQIRAADLKLEKFQLSGMIRSETEVWLQWPIYDADWKPFESGTFVGKRTKVEVSSERTQQIEDFLLGKGNWPGEYTPDLALPMIT